MNKWIAIVAVLAGSWFTAECLGGWVSFGIWSAVLLCTSAVGWWALRSLAVGELSWKNYFAGLVLPWGYQFGGGLFPIVFISSVFWVAACGASAWMGSLGNQDQAGPSVSILLRIAVLFGWMLNAWICCYLLAVLLKNQQWNSGPGRRILATLVIPIGMLTLSIGLMIGKQTWWAAVVALGPSMLLAIFYGLFLVTLITAGRNARWN